jgi:hypothetical protein
MCNARDCIQAGQLLTVYRYRPRVQSPWKVRAVCLAAFLAAVALFNAAMRG